MCKSNILRMQVGLPIALGGLAAVIIQTLYRVRCVPDSNVCGAAFWLPQLWCTFPRRAGSVACRNRGAFPTISTRSDFAVIFVFLAAYKLDSDSLSWTVRTTHVSHSCVRLFVNHPSLLRSPRRQGAFCALQLPFPLVMTVFSGNAL